MFDYMLSTFIQLCYIGYCLPNWPCGLSLSLRPLAWEVSVKLLIYIYKFIIIKKIFFPDEVHGTSKVRTYTVVQTTAFSGDYYPIILVKQRLMCGTFYDFSLKMQSSIASATLICEVFKLTGQFWQKDACVNRFRRCEKCVKFSVRYGP
jgi:hypothetical protein